MLLTFCLLKLFLDDIKELGVAIRSYVDDGLLTSYDAYKQICIAKIILTFTKIEKWVYENSFILDPAKFKAIYFSWTQNTPNPPIRLLAPLFSQDQTIICIV